uniref:Uncharacterized protein n=1 Tax=Fagus sylvatica TaxID=28930 RepID=A0A2N9GZI0_FAGSY
MRERETKYQLLALLKCSVLNGCHCVLRPLASPVYCVPSGRFGRGSGSTSFSILCRIRRQARSARRERLEHAVTIEPLRTEHLEQRQQLGTELLTTQLLRELSKWPNSQVEEASGEDMDEFHEERMSEVGNDEFREEHNEDPIPMNDNLEDGSVNEEANTSMLNLDKDVNMNYYSGVMGKY